ncbi:iron ABC transporter substrate-binding protein [Candidatus Thiodictyon syntrophicum]|uniref:Iron ABC transporter substrate-binding protein n=2 Tax=Candidatus Thiodictyon syntrophicum TaxID=1166950 RepID=A0A2K8UAE5_9GAMM|nr:iron ABC transporter substrate-binding protein [Candidatus Thiodictyon syntrophicum]
MKQQLLFALGALLSLCVAAGAADVVIYTSLDQVFSEPILRDFQARTGIEVKAVFDVEVSKTTGLVNRLIAERDRPRADVFWNSEVGRTLVLKDKGVLAPYRSPSAEDIPVRFKDAEGYWTGFAARARVLIYNKDLLASAELPQSVFELTAPAWRGRVTMGYPLFGTTATQVAAWYAVMGAEQAEAYLRALKDNDVRLVDGNAMTRDVVVQGEVPLGFTDTDDVYVAIQAGKPVGMIFPDREGLGTLMIPNTVALVAGAPHPQEARRLIDFLLSREVESKLAFSDSMQIPVRNGVDKPAQVPGFDSIRAMEVDYRAIADNLERATRFSRALFAR